MVIKEAKEALGNLEGSGILCSQRAECDPPASYRQKFMEMDHLGFTCPRCGVDLVVPASAAGAEGPCPRCGGVIKAPRITASPVEIPIRLEVRGEPIAKAKPVARFLPALEHPLVESTAMRSERLAVQRRWLFIVLMVLVVGSILAWFITAQVKEARSLSVLKPEVTTVKAAEPPPESPPETGARPEGSLLDYTSPPEGLDVTAFVTKSADILAKFLLAQNLDERLPLIETATPREELEQSLLAKPLEIRGNYESQEVKFDKVVGFNEILFKGGMAGKNGLTENYLILVRTRGSQSPRVVVDPFLDAFGGRFAAFAAEPREGVAKFRVLGTVFKFCSDEAIPAAELKYTLKISAAPGGPDLGKAYFGAASPLREKLEKLGVRYGHMAGATVSLRWNTEKNPYLEVVDVASLDWSE